MLAVLAAEFRPGDSVGLEFRLPDVSAPLRAKAVVRHQAQLQCGFEFLGLSHDQQASIRYWARRRTHSQPRIQPSWKHRWGQRATGTRIRVVLPLVRQDGVVVATMSNNMFRYRTK